MLAALMTIGVYGFTEEAFLHALSEAHVDTLADLRQRRGVRGREYAFANSRRLQELLRAAGIRYVHVQELAPPPAVRAIQASADRFRGDTKAGRSSLAPAFVEAYMGSCLSRMSAGQFGETVGKEARAVVLMCVERSPTACHRSIVADRYAAELGLVVRHLLP